MRNAAPLALGLLGGLSALVLVIDGVGGDGGANPQPPSPVEWQAEERKVLAGVRFPVYAPEGQRVQLSGWGGGDGEPVTSVSLFTEADAPDGRGIDVDSEFDGDTPEDDYATDAADQLRDAGGKVISSTRWLRVDGVKRRFAFASAGEQWSAIARVGDVTVTVRANAVDVGNVRLRALADPAGGLDDVPKYRPLRREFAVLDPRRVEELAAGTPLARLGRPLGAAALPALALADSEQPQPHWFGGTPRLPAGTRWPEGEYGPMTFVAQLSLADLDRTVWTGPADGYLHVFCDAEPESSDIEACTILRSEAGAELLERDFPRDLHENNRLGQTMVKPQPGLSLPEPAEPLTGRLGLDFQSDAERDALYTLQRRLESEQGWHDAGGHLLGWSAVPGEDLMEWFASQGGGAAGDWTLLLHTDAFDADLYIGIRKADLAARRFDRVEATIQFD